MNLTPNQSCEMSIQKAAFVCSMAAYGEYPGAGLPEIAIAGKSNVGKSSMINRLCNRQRLAKTSGTPGKTRMINIFRINDDFHLVDLPGYGFAKVSQAEQAKWGEMIEGYFARSALLSLVLHLVDIRHEPTAGDRDMLSFLRATEHAFAVIATKADKISRAKRVQNIHLIARTLQVQPFDIIPFSSEDGTGRDEVLERFARVCGVGDRGNAGGASLGTVE